MLSHDGHRSGPTEAAAVAGEQQHLGTVMHSAVQVCPQVGCCRRPLTVNARATCHAMIVPPSLGRSTVPALLACLVSPGCVRCTRVMYLLGLLGSTVRMAVAALAAGAAGDLLLLHARDARSVRLWAKLTEPDILYSTLQVTPDPVVLVWVGCSTFVLHYHTVSTVPSTPRTTPVLVPVVMFPGQVPRG